MFFFATQVYFQPKKPNGQLCSTRDVAGPGNGLCMYVHACSTNKKKLMWHKNGIMNYKWYTWYSKIKLSSMWHSGDKKDR